MGIAGADRQGLGLLIGQAFFIGLAFGLLYNIAYTSLVYEYGAAGLRLVYLLVGVVVPLVTIGFNALEEKLALSRFALLTVGAFAAAVFLLYFLTLIPNTPWIAFVLMVVNTMGSLYCMMLRGALASEIYDARTLKRRYPRITGGEVLAVVIAGVVVAPLAGLLGSLERVILVAGASMLLAVYLVHRFGSVFLAPHEIQAGSAHHEPDGEHDQHGFPALRAIISKRYTLVVFGYQLACSATSLLVQYLVYSEAQRFFLTQGELSQFIGLVKSGTTGVGFLFLTLAAGRLLIRFGMPVGLAGSPLGVAVLLAAALIAAVFDDGTGRTFFALIVASQFVEYTLYSGFAKTSVQSAFQPLPAHEREAVHTFVQGVGIPASYGITGLLLMGLAQIPGFTTVQAVYLTLAVAAVSGGLGALLYRGYGAALRHSLSRRHIEAVEFRLEDGSTLQVIDSLFASDDPRQVTTGLELLQEAGHPSYETRLQELIRHPDPEVRREVYRRVEESAPSWARAALGGALVDEPDEDARGNAVLALCSVVEEPTPVVLPFLRDESRPVRTAAVTGLFLYGGINGILQAGDVFNRLVSSSEPSERVDAAFILERVGIRNFYHPLHTLLADPELSVVRAALKAARSVAHPALLDDIVPWIDPVATRPEALAALTALGPDLVPLLERSLNGDAGLSPAGRLRVIRAAARVADQHIVRALEARIEHPEPEVAFAVYTALSRCGYKAGANVEPAVRRLLDAHTLKAALSVLALSEIGSDQRLQPLTSALNDFYRRHLEAVFLLLTFLYDQDEIMGLRQKIVEGGAKQRALGLELLEVELAGTIKQRVLAIAEHPDNRPPDSAGYGELFGLKGLSSEERVAEILGDAETWPEDWLRVCARFAGYQLGIISEPPEGAVLSTIERVVTLKSADIFSSIPDSILAHIASIAEDLEISAGQTFIHQGDLGTCMYIICHGRVAIHDENTRFAELGPGRVVGEMAVLDPEPRSASVTALEDTSLLRIDKDAFDSVLVDHPDIAQAVIQVLCRRLREMIKPGQ